MSKFECPPEAGCGGGFEEPVCNFRTDYNPCCPWCGFRMEYLVATEK